MALLSWAPLVERYRQELEAMGGCPGSGRALA